MREMLRNPPSLVKVGNGSAKYDPRPVTARRPTRRFFPLVLVAFALSYLAYTRFSHGVTGTYNETSTFSSSSATANKKSPALEDLPKTAVLEPRPHKLELLTPMYNVKILRSILQHSNTSWQDKPGESHGYFIQSLVWFQNIDGLRPDIPADFMRTSCRFPNHDVPSDLGRTGGHFRQPYLTTPGILHTHQTHPGDRKIGHDFVFFIDCELPPSLQQHPELLGDVSLSVAMEVGILDTPTLKGMRENITVIVGNDDIPLKLYQPSAQRSEFAVCLSALTYKLENAPLWHLLEWRMYMQDIGVDRVDWYGREASFGKFVEIYKSKKGGQDTFSHVPNLVTHEYRGPAEAWEKYTDQDAWYMDCIMKNAFSSDYILVIDTDEFPMVDWRRENPLDQFKEFMRGVPASKGSIEFDRVGMARPSEKGKHVQNELMQLQYDCINSADNKIKTLYRARSVFAVNQHKPRKGGMYPMPPEARLVEVNPKPHMQYLWHLQHGYQDDVWPKLVHYRYYDIPEMDTCSDPSPMSAMPKYTEYLSKLRKEVASLATHIKGI